MGHRGISHYGRWMAAALACGEGVAVSHRSAAELWGLLKPQEGPIDVSTPSGAGRARRAGIRLHRRAAPHPGAMTRRYGIPVTKPAQTISDLRRRGFEVVRLSEEQIDDEPERVVEVLRTMLDRPQLRRLPGS